MTDRETLVALIKEADCSSLTYGECSRCKYGCKGDCSYQFLADHLIANGVVAREKGEWVYDHWCEFKCSKCGALSKTEPRGEENFCPNCGADMRKGENG